jgi:hypothetical protein
MALTEEQINERLEEVKKIRFFLDADPTVLGLNSLLTKLAECQLQKDRVSFLVMEAMKNMSEHEIQKEMTQGDYDRNMDLALTDPQVAAQKSAELRQTHAKLKMPEKVLALHQMEVASIRASWYLKILQSMYSNLESANNNLSRQITVLQLESGINGGSGLSRGTMKNINI